MFNILLIDCEEERGETLKQRIEKCNCQVKHELQVKHLTPKKNWELMILHRSSRNSDGEDFAHDNFLSSGKPVIYYGGGGVIAEANTKGWLSRFFSSPVFPF